MVSLEEVMLLRTNVERSCHPTLSRQNPDMPNVTLDTVEVQDANIMFDKKHYLAHILRGVACSILYYKQPPHIPKVKMDRADKHG